MLDPALKRPGRFDIVITIEDLDVDARLELLQLATRRLPLDAGVDLQATARSTVGMSGAQLTQAVKEAAVLALREAPPEAAPGSIEVTSEHLREAVTATRYGLRREGPLPSSGEMKRTAVHEAGHALMAELERPGSVHQATILPRGRALGFVESLPASEVGSLTFPELQSRMRVALAGRSAEIELFGPRGVSAGCCQDLEVATRVAVDAVTRFGMSEQIGPVAVGVLEHARGDSQISERVDAEIQRMIRAEEAYVLKALRHYRPALESIARLLIKRESINGNEIRSALRSIAPAQRSPKGSAPPTGSPEGKQGNAPDQPADPRSSDNPDNPGNQENQA
jgi:cell division protease FtsH